MEYGDRLELQVQINSTLKFEIIKIGIKHVYIKSIGC